MCIRSGERIKLNWKCKKDIQIHDGDDADQVFIVNKSGDVMSRTGNSLLTCCVKPNKKRALPYTYNRTRVYGFRNVTKSVQL